MPWVLYVVELVFEAKASCISLYKDGGELVTFASGNMLPLKANTAITRCIRTYSDSKNREVAQNVRTLNATPKAAHPIHIAWSSTIL
jgi:hypothetical protein